VVVRFSVSDTGTGIPRDRQADIFKMFEQADSSTTRRFGGAGLGLAISSRLVEMMGGRIWVESEVSRGSTFHFTARFELPRGEAAGRAVVSPAIVRGVKVLVVDDNATNRHILEEVLKSWRMEPTVVEGGRHALDVLHEAQEAGNPYRLVFTDEHMPEMDGFTLVERIRQDPKLDDTIVMILTSGGRFDGAAQCEVLRISAYLLKPVKQSELLDATMRAMGGSSPEEEVPGVPATRSPSQVGPLRVLLAEDSLVNQKLAVALLEKCGHTAVVTENGREAVAASESQDFDLILMDVQMPQMDGFEATSVIRAREKGSGKHVPIIALTAHAMKGDRERCLEAGMDDYVAKPIDATELLETIEAVVAIPGGPTSSGG
jgi:CheY-like chemotaxis protein